MREDPSAVATATAAIERPHGGLASGNSFDFFNHGAVFGTSSFLPIRS